MAEKKSESMLAGLTNKSPKSVDESMTPKGGSVNSEPVRSGPAKTPKSLGPRSA